ncbi:MAG: hypothetical protein KGP14_09155 [Betaproteobacteria bacterium]|nr:hypothetical protein [Betaproteobacteria bacterium]
MAATKTAKTLLTSQSLAAAASANATEWNMSTAYGGLATVKLTNGASAPTTVPTVTFYVGEATGVKRKLYTATGDTVANSVNDIVCEIPPGAMFVNITITNGATNAITVEAYGQELTTI